MSLLLLQDGTTVHGTSFGANTSVEGEVVYMPTLHGYPEILTDKSLHGAIVVFGGTLGAYGVPSASLNDWGFAKFFESESAQIRGVVCSAVATIPSQHIAISTLHTWLEHHEVPGIYGVDVDELYEVLTVKGSLLGRMTQDETAVYTPVSTALQKNILLAVSCPEVQTYVPTVQNRGAVLLYDFGVRNTLLRHLLQQGFTVYRVPHSYDVQLSNLSYQAVILSDGPSDLSYATSSIAQIRSIIARNVPTFAIGFGAHILGAAIGASIIPTSTYSGPNCAAFVENTNHHSVVEALSIQRHALVESSLPVGYSVWWRHASTNVVAGIKHNNLPIYGVYFAADAVQSEAKALALISDFLSAL